MLQLALGYVVGVIFWCKGKFELFTWLPPKVPWEFIKSSCTGLSAALELSDNDRGPESAKSVWFDVYLGTRREEGWEPLWEWFACVCDDTNPRCWSKSVAEVSGSTKTKTFLLSKCFWYEVGICSNYDMQKYTIQGQGNPVLEQIKKLFVHLLIHWFFNVINGSPYRKLKSIEDYALYPGVPVLPKSNIIHDLEVFHVIR